MPDMRGVTIVVAGISPERFRSAFNLALATAALGGRTRIFLDGEAVSMVRQPIAGRDDAAYAAAGLPTLSALHAEALDAGVRLILCQSGLAMIGAEPRDFDARAEYGGMVGLLAELGEDRLVAV